MRRIEEPYLNKRVLILFVTSFCAIVLFIMIFLSLESTVLWKNIDPKVIEAVSAFENPIFTGVARVIDILLDELIVIVTTLLVGLFLLKRAKKEAIFFVSTVAASAIILWVLKLVIGRARPENGLIRAASFAFPSGHTLMATVFFGLIIYLVFRKMKKGFLRNSVVVALVLSIVVVAISRLYLRVHWVSDVIGGILLGVFVLCGALIIRNGVERKSRVF